MFDPAQTGSSPSLLMRARAHDDGRSGSSDQDGHLAARKRREARAGTVPSALGSHRAGDADEASDRSPTEHDAKPGAKPNQTQPRPVDPPSGAASTAGHAPFAGQGGAGLIDPVAMLTTIWRWRFVIVLCTALGAVAGVLVAMSTPHRYTAYSEVLIDPREVQLVGRDLEREFLANEAALAIVDSRLSLVRSRPVLERVIEATNLDQDREFNGAAAGGIGLLDGVGVIMSLFGDETPVDTSARTTLENLRDAIEIDRTTRTFVVTIGVEAGSPQKAAMLANEVTEAFIEEQGSISSDKAREANSALTGRLDELQANVEQAERRIEDFRIENGLVSAQGRLLTDDDLAAASTQLADARAATIRARSKAEEANAITIDDAIAGSVPIDLNTPALTTFRAQHASLRQNAAQLENQLGPRHPRLTGAQAAIAAARQDIATELTRIVQGAQSELRRAVQTEQELAAQVARAKAAKSDQSDAMVTLRDLQAEAEAARAIYNNALLRARETGEIGALGTVNAAILSRAEPPLTASSMSRKTIAIAFTIAGFLAGLGIATLAGLHNAVRFDALGGSAGATGPSGDPDPDDPKPTRTATQDTQAMHSRYPYPPSAYPHQPAAHPAGHASVDPSSANRQHAHHQPAAPQHWPGHGMQGAAPYHAPPMPPAPAAHGWPQPDPAAFPTPAYPDHTGPAYASMPPQPAPWPADYPGQGPARWPAASAPTYPAPVPAAPPQDHGTVSEMDELRQSLADLREVVEELAARRGNVRRFG